MREGLEFVTGKAGGWEKGKGESNVESDPIKSSFKDAGRKWISFFISIWTQTEPLQLGLLKETETSVLSGLHEKTESELISI